MRKNIVLIILGLLLAGCGTFNKDMEMNGEGSGMVKGEIIATIEEKTPLIFQYKLKNQTEKEETMEFTSSQRFDYSVDSITGERIYLYSSLTSFLQVLGKETIRQGESLLYEISLQDLGIKTGDYILTVWMTPKEGPSFIATKKFHIE